MASTSPKTPCITCGKGIGLFKCEGCIQTFCTKHVLEHRQTLHHQLDEIVIGHDILQQNIMENKDQKHPWMNFIDEWEQKSIEKIQQMAKETRQKFTDFVDIHRSNNILNTILIIKLYLYRKSIRRIKSSF
jgi:uncharacterized UBP type Zn finger protein